MPATDTSVTPRQLALLRAAARLARVDVETSGRKLAAELGVDLATVQADRRALVAAGAWPYPISQGGNPRPRSGWSPRLEEPDDDEPPEGSVDVAGLAAEIRLDWDDWRLEWEARAAGGVVPFGVTESRYPKGGATMIDDVPWGIKRAAPMPGGVSPAGPPVGELLRADMAGREAKGLETYGRPLRPHMGGVDPLRMALEEALDLAYYLRSALYERDGR
jgi:hypothetical protein